MSSIGSVIKDLRTIRHWSQGKLAAVSGVKRSTISLIEKYPNRKPEHETLEKIASAFNMTVDELLAPTRVQSSDKLPLQNDTPLAKIGRIRELAISELGKLERELADYQRSTAIPVLELPVFTRFPHCKNMDEEPVTVIAIPQPAKLEEIELEAYTVNHPVTNKPEDTVVVDWQSPPQSGDFVMCLWNGQKVYGVFRRFNGQGVIFAEEKEIAAEDAEYIAVVIYGVINRKRR